MHFTVSRPLKKIKAQPGGEAASPPACAIRAFIGLHGQQFISKTRIWLGLRFSAYRSLNSNMMLEVEYQKLEEYKNIKKEYYERVGKEKYAKLCEKKRALKEPLVEVVLDTL